MTNRISSSLAVLRYDPAKGETIHFACRQVCRMARSYGERAWLTFNGTPIGVPPGLTTEQAVDAWTKIRERRQECGGK